MRKFTAEDVLESMYDINDQFSSLEKLEFIQHYARQVAEQALQDACEKVTKEFIISPNGPFCKSILSTIIKTP